MPKSKQRNETVVEQKQFIETIVEIMKKAVVYGSDENKKVIQQQYEQEELKLAKFQLGVILEDFEIARKKQVPLCQDTGAPVFYIKLGNEVRLNFDLKTALAEAVRQATERVPLRRNVVHPVSRQNTNDNTGMGFPYTFFDYFEGDYMEVLYYPKGGGSENMSKLKMFNSVATLDEVKQFIIETAAEFMGKCCSPYTLGVGIGGGADICMNMAKKAALRDPGVSSNDPQTAKMEKELQERINSLGIGPMGLGGKKSLITVNIEVVGTHPSTYPVGIANNCWPGRKACVRFYQDGRVEHC